LRFLDRVNLSRQERPFPPFDLCPFAAKDSDFLLFFLSLSRAFFLPSETPIRAGKALWFPLNRVPRPSYSFLCLVPGVPSILPSPYFSDLFCQSKAIAGLYGLASDGFFDTTRTFPGLIAALAALCLPPFLFTQLPLPPPPVMLVSTGGREPRRCLFFQSDR